MDSRGASDAAENVNELHLSTDSAGIAAGLPGRIDAPSRSEGNGKLAQVENDGTGSADGGVPWLK
jgi:hypothetical protein